MKLSLALALLGAAASIGIPNALAQPNPIVKNGVVRSQAIDHQIVLEDVDAHAMAYLLDPTHNSPPRGGGSAAQIFRDQPLAQPLIALPGTITQLFPTSPLSNRLLVTGGSDGDVQELKKIIQSLSLLVRPKENRARIEMEALVVDISSADLKTMLALDPALSDKLTLSANLVFSSQVHREFGARLNALVAKGEAKIVAAPRLTAFDKTSVPLPLTNTDAALNTLLVSVTPSINADGSISMFVKAETGRRGATVSNGEIMPNDSTSVFLGLTLLSQPGNTKASREESPRHTALFLTPHIVRPNNGKTATN